MENDTVFRAKAEIVLRAVLSPQGLQHLAAGAAALFDADRGARRP